VLDGSDLRDKGLSMSSCTGWRLGISPVIWPSLRDPRERPRAGSDCTSRKCALVGGVVRRYTVCRVPRHPFPRLRVYDNNRMVASMTVQSFDAGQNYIDRQIKAEGLAGLRRTRRGGW
jgi:hypothetical protein